MPKNCYAFIDESGSPDLNTEKPGNRRHYIICAIKIIEDELQSLTDSVEDIRKRHFQTGEIKSSSVSQKKGSRRARILTDIQSLNFSYYALVVDKEKLYKDSGLAFKKSFIKFFSGRVCSEIMANHETAHIIADTHGYPEFQSELQNYIEGKKDLFTETSTFKTLDSKDSVLVQLADFIAGTISHIYEKTASAEVKEAYRNLTNKCTKLDPWTTHPNELEVHHEPTGIDNEIKNHAIRQARIFINNNQSSSDPDIKKQVVCLSHMLLDATFNNQNSYISTYELRAHLASLGLETSEQAIRSSIIAKLRDAGVIIASSQKGYKIPQCFSDIKDFIERVDGIVIPLLQRLNKARFSYLQESNNGIDIITGTKYLHLEKILRLLEDEIKAPPHLL
jgi:biotin operon repressor